MHKSIQRRVWVANFFTNTYKPNCKTEPFVVLIAPLYAGQHGKIKNVLRYFNQFLCIDEEYTANLMLQLALQELDMAESIYQQFLRLKVCPKEILSCYTFDHLFSTPSSCTKTGLTALKKMLYDDVVQEMATITYCTKLLNTCSQQDIVCLLQNLSNQANQHLVLLNNQLSKLASNT